MSDPFFPPPRPRSDEAGGYREAAAPVALAAPAAEAARKPAIVVRPDPPAPDEVAPGKKPRPNLSKEEIGALLATEGAKSSALVRSGKRAVIVVPLGLLEIFLELAFDIPPLVRTFGSVLLAVPVLLFIARPLWTYAQEKKKGWV